MLVSEAVFASDFKVVVVNGENIETKLTAKSAFTKWLKGNVIYKSNSQGELNKALVLDEGMHLRNTALRVTEKQPLFSAKGDSQRVLLFQTAKAITKQATMFKDIMGEAKSIFNAAYNVPAKPAASTETKTEDAAA